MCCACTQRTEFLGINNSWEFILRSLSLSYSLFYSTARSQSTLYVCTWHWSPLKQNIHKMHHDNTHERSCSTFRCCWLVGFTYRQTLVLCVYCAEYQIFMSSCLLIAIVMISIHHLCFLPFFLLPLSSAIYEIPLKPFRKFFLFFLFIQALLTHLTTYPFNQRSHTLILSCVPDDFYEPCV